MPLEWGNHVGESQDRTFVLLAQKNYCPTA